METLKGIVDFVAAYPLWAQILAMGGLLIAVLTLVFVPRTAAVVENAVGHSVTVTSPRGGQGVAWEFPVVFTAEGLPDDPELWIMTTDSAGQRFWPQERAIGGANQTWRGRVTGIGGEPGDRRTFGVFLVGPDGKALLELWQRAIPYQKALELRLLTDDIRKLQEVDVVVETGRPEK